MTPPLKKVGFFYYICYYKNTIMKITITTEVINHLDPRMVDYKYQPRKKKKKMKKAFMVILNKSFEEFLKTN